MAALPDDLIARVLAHTECLTLVRAAQVCRLLHRTVGPAVLARLELLKHTYQLTAEEALPSPMQRLRKLEVPSPCPSLQPQP